MLFMIKRQHQYLYNAAMLCATFVTLHSIAVTSLTARLACRLHYIVLILFMSNVALFTEISSTLLLYILVESIWKGKERERGHRRMLLKGGP